MTLKLYGVFASSYYNFAKLALLEKNMPFEEVPQHPNEKTSGFLAMSPVGKIPCMETEAGVLSESLAIVAYAEAQQPNPALFPQEPMVAGRAMQIHQFLTHYVNGAAGSLVPTGFFGAPEDQAVTDAGFTQVNEGVQYLAQVCVFDPYIAGKHLSHADLIALVSLDLVEKLAELYDRPNPLDALSGWRNLRPVLMERPHIKASIEGRDGMWQHILQNKAM
ncbi:Glutathione S-transferase family protein [Sulfidibacter corallicola]|uniref:Glutathione S-transferase family protein n=1 Tax=Sulfidibacter corallicola TaxID=2818388 RepID=A0A8A4TQS6_SULCO|nr:glutathione S-transferase family protein [Sulfidibacter corallicola]QTD52329.1 glutathione S-transferase family protein [Sulfidibacter corallicola]